MRWTFLDRNKVFNRKVVSFKDWILTIFNLLKVSWLYEVRLHYFKPPKELSNENHHVMLEEQEQVKDCNAQRCFNFPLFSNFYYSQR